MQHRWLSLQCQVCIHTDVKWLSPHSNAMTLQSSGSDDSPRESRPVSMSGCRGSTAAPRIPAAAASTRSATSARIGIEVTSRPPAVIVAVRLAGRWEAWWRRLRLRSCTVASNAGSCRRVVANSWKKNGVSAASCKAMLVSSHLIPWS